MEVTLGNTIGAMFLGTVFAAMLYGITNLQVYLYYQHYSNDGLVQKISVALLWFLDTFHLSLTIVAVYHYLIDSFGVFDEVEFLVWSFKLQIAVNVVIVIVVQFLYTVRVWKLGRHYQHIWPIIVIVIVAIGYAIGITAAVKIYSISGFTELSQVAWVIAACFVSTTVTDIVIAASICFYLIRNKSGFSRTNNKIVIIIRMTLISGFFTSACSLVALISFAVMPGTLVFFGIEFLLTKLYINSFLAMLNARQSLRDADTLPGNSLSITRIMNIHTTTSSHIATSGGADDKNAVQLTPLSEDRHGLDSGVDLEEIKGSGNPPELSDNRRQVYSLPEDAQYSV